MASRIGSDVQVRGATYGGESTLSRKTGKEEDMLRDRRVPGDMGLLTISPPSGRPP